MHRVSCVPLASAAPIVLQGCCIVNIMNDIYRQSIVLLLFSRDYRLLLYALLAGKTGKIKRLCSIVNLYNKAGLPLVPVALLIFHLLAALYAILSPVNG